MGFQKITYYGLLISFLFCCNTLDAQTRRDALEQKRKNLLEKIETTSKKLSKTQQTKAAALEKLETLHQQIEHREELINTLNDEVDDADDIISRTDAVITALRSDAVRLQKEYATTLRKAHRLRLTNNSFLFLFASKNVAQAYRRWMYFKQYERFRLKQSKLIGQTRQALAAKNMLLTQQMSKKQSLVGTYDQQRERLDSERRAKDALIGTLKSEEQRLRSDLKKQESNKSKLANAIQNVIASEEAAKLRAAEARARARDAERLRREKPVRGTKIPASEPTPTTSIVVETPENITLANDFRANKGKLPFPVESGTVVRRFGSQPHPTLPKVQIENSGIDINAPKGAAVRCVFTGLVLAVQSVNGAQVVMVQHGSYYSVYSNLSDASVKRGDIVQTRQSIGRVATDPLVGQSLLHFEIWLQRTPTNPSPWLNK
jgi:murein hydrolase activator